LGGPITGYGLGDLTTENKSRLFILKLITEAYWRGFRLDSLSICNIYNRGKRLLIMGELLHKYLSRLFFLNELADFLGQVLGLELIAKLSTEI